MLERASTCLENGGRQLFRAPKRCLRSRRMLHSSFWHHGAADLALPVGWASSVLNYAHDADDRVGGKPSTASVYPDSQLLDFLYPEKTLALIHRLSAYGSDVADTRRRHIRASGIRSYSTARWQNFEGEATDNAETLETKKKMEQLLLGSTPEEALQHLLESNRSGEQELAWQLYSAISERVHIPFLQADLLDYLAAADISRTAGRLLQVFDNITNENRRASSYRGAIAAYVALKMVGPAIQLQEEAALRFNFDCIGTDIVLQRTIQDNQWDLALRVFRTYLEQTDRQKLNIEVWIPRKNKEDFEAVWGQVARLPDLVEHLSSFLGHVRQFRHELSSTAKNKRSLDLFVRGFIPSVMDQVINHPKPDEDQIWNYFTALFRDLRSLDLPTPYLYEYCIATMVNTPRYREYSNRRNKIYFELYRQYRKQFLETGRAPPSRYLISRLIIQHGEKASMRGVGQMTNDLRTFYPDDPFTAQTLAYLIRFYAKHGDVEHVQEYFNECRSRYPETVNLYLLSSLLYAYARRIDIPGTVQQFERIQKEFGLVPDLACWNTLLLVYARADDLDGALDRFNQCLDSGVKPDIYTFGPMLDLCAARGDVEAFEALFSRAQQLNIPVDSDHRARAGYVRVFLNADDAEGAEAIAHGMYNSWFAGTFRGDASTHALTDTWNELIVHYAVRGDLTNSRRIYQQMVKIGIPLNTWTYGALMRALIEARQTNAAYKILRETMHVNNMRVHAYHYAIVITGFLRESQHKHAKRAYRSMQERKIPQTPSSRQATLLAIGTEELRNLRDQKVTDPKARLVAVEEQLRASIMANYGTELAYDQPKHHQYIDSREFSNVPKGYFALLIMLYTTRGAFDISKELFKAATQSHFTEEKFQAPIGLLTAIMDAHLKAKEYAAVARCWNLARTEAGRLVKTVQQVMHPETRRPESVSITDPKVKESFESSRIATNRRQILVRTARIYIRSLLAQEGTAALKQAQHTIHDLLTHGFVLDNLTWNEFIQNLALRGHIIDAFSACEMYLMPSFPGWRELNPTYTRHDIDGYLWMELRHTDINKSSLMPRYKTLVILAAAFAQVRQDEANGIGFNTELGGWTKEVLEKISPLTVRAIDTMPRTGDSLQRQYLLDSRTN